MARQQHFADRSERAIRQWQLDGSVDTRVDPAIAATALGSMVARFAELWLVQGYANYDFDKAVDQLTLFWANALGLPAPGENAQPVVIETAADVTPARKTLPRRRGRQGVRPAVLRSARGGGSAVTDVPTSFPTQKSLPLFGFRTTNLPFLTCIT